MNTPAEVPQDPLDLLDGLSSTPAAPPPAAGVDNLIQDPFADALGTPEVNQAAMGGALVQVEGDIHQWFWGLSTKDKGVIYEDTLMQVKVL